MFIERTLGETSRRARSPHLRHLGRVSKTKVYETPGWLPGTRIGVRSGTIPMSPKLTKTGAPPRAGKSARPGTDRVAAAGIGTLVIAFTR